jgi:hypothetical protein
MARLPIPNSDAGVWGGILNDFLVQSHDVDGSLKTSAIASAAAQTFVDLATSQTIAGTKTFSTAPIVPNNSFPESAVSNLTSDLASKISSTFVTTKGDLLVGTGVATVNRLGVGSNYQVLKASSATPSGLVWDTDQVTNVKDYGATGNGSTDDTAAINNAITAAKSSTQMLFFPPGNYIVSSALNVGGGFPGGLYIYGVGWNSQISLANNANCYMFTFSNVYTPGLVIRDLFLGCNGANQTADSGGIDAHGAVSCRFENLQIDTPFYDGIYVHNNGVGGFGQDNTIDSCWFNNGKHANGPGQGLEIYQSDENYIVNCTFGDNGNPANTYPYHNGAQPGGLPFQVFESAGLQHFLNNSFVNGGAGTTQLRTIGSRSIFANNVFDGGSGQQLHINGNANIVQGNMFVNIGSAASAGSPKAGLYLDGMSRNIATANVFTPIASGSGFAIAGIWTDFGADHNDIKNNEFSLDNTTGTWTYAPIKLNTGNGNNYLDGNNGFVTQAVGTASITSSQTSVTVNHGLAPTLTLANINIIITPQSSLGTLASWVNTVTSTQFTINLSAAPGSTTTFYWQAQVLQG